MKTKTRMIRIALLLSVSVGISACEHKKLPDDPCFAADRAVTLGNLLQNSMSGAYEACLANVRMEATRELEK